MNPLRTNSPSLGRGTIAFALVTVLASVPCIAGPLSPKELDGNGFVLRGVRVFDGTRTIEKTDVVVRDGRIVSVGHDAAPARGLPVVDGTGRTLLPGLIDAHTHTYGDARRDALRFGVTAELDMFTDWHQLADARRERGSFAKTDRSDLWSAGTLATVPGGHGTEYGFAIPTLTKAADAQPFVDARLAEASDYVKIVLEDGTAFNHPMPSLDTPTLDALIVATHARQRLAIAHVATEADAVRAADGGIDGLAHVFMDRPADPEAVAAIKRHGAFVVPTLSVAATIGGAGEGARLASDARLGPALSADQTRALNAGFPAAATRAPLFDNAIESTRRLHDAGVTILAGTDAGNPGTTHGATMHQELALLVRAGLTPVEALQAATEKPARLFSLGDRGRIADGMRADLVLVDGDPTRDIAATRAISAIWKNGYLVDRTAPKTAVVATAPASGADPVVADFETGAIATRSGQNWAVTTDRLAGGTSSATQTWIAGGAGGSKGAMHVEGQVATGMAYPWAGTLFMPGGAPFDAVDFSARTTLVFHVRGNPRENVAMIFSGPPENRMPSSVRFRVTSEWTEVRIPLAQFAGADLARLRGLAFTAGLPAGAFAFELDDVELR